MCRKTTREKSLSAYVLANNLSALPHHPRLTRSTSPFCCGCRETNKSRAARGWSARARARRTSLGRGGRAREG